ncbi:hypothetical protein [Nocardioides ungokensis]
MRLLRSPVLLRRASWVALLSGLLGLWAHHWRGNIVNNYSWSPGNYAAATNLMHIFGGVFVVALACVGLCLVTRLVSRPPE